MDFSIISVTYNCSKSITGCIDSVASQEGVSLEHIVVDGGSSDSTYQNIMEFQNSKIRSISEPDSGIYEALNKGIRMSSGEIVGVLHCDDIFFGDDVLIKIRDMFQSNTDINMVCGSVIFKSGQINKKKQRLYDSSLFRPWMLRFGFMPAHTAMFIKSDVIRDLGGYNESFRSSGDFDFFVRYFNSPHSRCILSNMIITQMTIGGKSTSGMKSYSLTTKEILHSLKLNKIFTLKIFVLFRLPIKFLYSYFFKYPRFSYKTKTFRV